MYFIRIILVLAHARRQIPACIFVLLATALTPNMAGADERGDFFLAVAQDNGYWVGKLLEGGVNPNLKQAKGGDTGLILALREHSMHAFQVLLNASEINFEATADNGDTALMIASYTDNMAAVAALLDKDVEVNKPGWTALHYAAAIGSCEIIKILLEKYAYIDAESPNKTTPIMMAARAGRIAAVELLLDEGADAALRNEQGMNAIDFAVKNDHRELAERLAGRLGGRK